MSPTLTELVGIPETLRLPAAIGFPGRAVSTVSPIQEKSVFDITTSIFDEESGEISEELLGKYVSALSEEFVESPEFQALSDHPQSNFLHIYLDYAARHLGLSAGDMTYVDSNEILFDLFPRKVSIDAADASVVISEIRAFWQFIDRTRNLPVAAEILDGLGDDAESELEDMLSDASNFGMAKSFVSMGKKLGFDMSSQAEMSQFIAYYNATLVPRQSPERQGTANDTNDDSDGFRSGNTIPGEHSRIPRNGPCICGSGKKYKKCCGRIA